jgi:hypothetical protein
MAIGIKRLASFGAGSRGFRFEVRQDTVMDKKVYETGRHFEEARFQTGSFGQRVFERLAGNDSQPPSNNTIVKKE